MVFLLEHKQAILHIISLSVQIN